MRLWRLHRKNWLIGIGCLLVCLSTVLQAVAGPADDFFKAIETDDTRTTTTLLFRGLDPNTVNSKGVPGLVWAVQLGSLKVARLLITQNKTNIEARTPQDESALMMAALGGHEDIAKTLISKGADVNKAGWTPLHYAATKGQLSIIRLLLDQSAYIDAESPNKSTPLMMAAMYGTVDAVKLLVEEGADIALKNERGLTALEFAKIGHRKDAEAYLFKVTEARRPKGSW